MASAPLFSRLGRALTDPARAAYILRAKFDRPGLMRHYARLAREAGLDRVYLLLSFDCDTEEDIEVAWDVHTRLTDLGAKVAYAVPGELLKQGAAVYRRIFEAGGEFINHGYVKHTYFDHARGDHASCFFYDQLPRIIVHEDIVNGDKCMAEVLGRRPNGFRAPHFSTFQKPAELRFLHATVTDLGYRFSSSTTPYHAFHRGPVYRAAGVREIPVSGMGSAPLRILDSWNCFRAPGRTLGPEDYRREGAAYAAAMQKLGVGLLNYYADPCHVHGSDAFFATVREWLKLATPVSFDELLGITR